MTESEWLACDEVAKAVTFLRGKTTARKRILLGCACCRLLHGHFLAHHSELRGRVEVAERYADGQATEDEYAAATRGLSWPIEDEEANAVMRWLTRSWYTATEAGVEVLPVLREVFRPFPRPGSLGWLGWQGGTVTRLAEGVSQERAFGEMPILADALEDAGCTDDGLLAHLRSAGPHVRGCWALDLVLGKS
jgi:hypothetical protein